MTDFYVKIPDDKVDFFTQLLKNLDFEYEKLFSNENVEEDSEEYYFTDSDD